MCKRYLFLLLPVCLLAGNTANAGFGDLLKSAEGVLGTSSESSGSSTAGSSLSEGQIDAGLKQALSIGAERAVAVLGQNGGFLNDQAVRIGLPKSLDVAAKGLRAVGQGKYVDEFEVAVNRAAEQAVPATLDIIKDTVSSMSLSDVRGILSGGDDAATQFLKDRAGGSIHEAILPIVSDATDKAGATSAYKTLADKAGGSLGALGGIVGTDSLDLDSYVTDKAMSGLFLKLANEEKQIRENPLARSTDLLKTVFGG